MFTQYKIKIIDFLWIIKCYIRFYYIYDVFLSEYSKFVHNKNEQEKIYNMFCDLLRLYLIVILYYILKEFVILLDIRFFRTLIFYFYQKINALEQYNVIYKNSKKKICI